MRPLLALQVGVILGSLASCRAQDKPREEHAIRELVLAFAKAENSRDAAKFSALFVADGDVILQGRVLARGPEDIKKLVKPRMPWSEIGPAVYNIQGIHFLNANSAIADTERTAYSSTITRKSLATFIFTKAGGQWKVASYRNFQPGPYFPPDSPFASGSLHQ